MMQLSEKTLKARLDSFVNLYNKNNFPVDAMMFGFGNIKIADRDECMSRIVELADILKLRLVMRETTIERDNIKVREKQLEVEK